MPHEPTRDAASACHTIEAASAFAGREMLAEARRALQGARAALALRGDAGPAHWCDACLVALEIAARGGDVPELETETARLRSLSGDGRYWMEQARARIGEHASRISPARLDHVLAVLAGEAAPAAPLREPARSTDAAYPVVAHCPLATSPGPLVAPFAASVLPTAEDEDAEPVFLRGEGGGELDAIPAFSADRCAPSSTAAENQTAHCAAPHAVVEPDTAGIDLPDPPPPSSGAAPAIAHRREIVSAALTMKTVTRHLARSWVQGAVLVILALAALPWAFRSVYSSSAVLSRSSAAEHALRTGGPARALQTASAPPEAGEAAPHTDLVLGRSLLAAGDTAGAVAAFARAAQSDSRGTIAWTAAEALARLPGHSACAADAYLLAFAAGLPSDRVETIARAQELAGRPERAERVREHAAAQ